MIRAEQLTGSQLSAEVQPCLQPIVMIDAIESSNGEEDEQIVVVRLNDGDGNLRATLLLPPGGSIFGSSDGNNCKRVRKGLVIRVLHYSMQRKKGSQTHEGSQAAIFIQIDAFDPVGVQQCQEQASDAEAEQLSPRQQSQCHGQSTQASDVVDDTEELSEDTGDEVSDELMSIVTSDETSSSCEMKSTHRLEHLGSEGIKTWSVRAYVTAVSPVTEFVRANNRGVGKFMRVQLRDTNAQLEAVVFEPHCEREPFSSLKLNSKYLISDGEIKAANSSMIKWPYAQLSLEQKAKFRQVPFEIRVNKNTKFEAFEKINEAEQSYVCSNGVVGEADVAVGTNDESNSSKCGSSNNTRVMLPPNGATKVQAAVVSNQRAGTVSCPLVRQQPPMAARRLLLSDLIQRPSKSLVTVLCIVCKMMPFNADTDTVASKSPRFAMQQKSIAVRRFVVVDTSGVTVPVAVWGDQATYCTLEVGHCVLFKEVEVSNYGGFSLSVIQRSGIMYFGSCEELDKDVKAVAKKHSKASRIVECTNVKDAFFQELAEWWQQAGSALYRE
jgi:hypothetical protein